jgi:NADH:ubiquinone oxidoreductase subunit K
MKTLTDKSDSKIAELLLNGVNMGIIEGRKILNKKNINKEVSKIISIYVTMQESCVEVLKSYL